MELVFVAFGLYWIIESLIPEPTVCWREVKVEEGRVGANVPCTKEELEVLRINHEEATKEVPTD